MINNLKEKNMTTTTIPASTVPTVSSSVTVDWGDWVAQLLQNETPVLEALGESAVASGLAMVPFGSIVSTFIGPTIVKQYVDQALVGLETLLEKENASVPTSNTVLVYVLNMIKTYEPTFATYLGTQLTPLIETEIAKLFPAK